MTLCALHSALCIFSLVEYRRKPQSQLRKEKQQAPVAPHPHRSVTGKFLASAALWGGELHYQFEFYFCLSGMTQAHPFLIGNIVR